MKLVKSSDKEWLEKKGYSKRIFLTEKDLKRKGMHVQELKIRPGEIAKSHYHKKQTEIFYFLNGNGYFVVNGKKINLETGDILVIEPKDKHEIVNDSDEDFLYIAFKFDYEEGDSFWTD